MNLSEIFTYPYDNDILLRKQKSIRRELLARKDISYTPVRVAILGGSTVDDIKNVLELFLLECNIKPVFYQSEYNKYYEDAVFGNAEALQVGDEGFEALEDSDRAPLGGQGAFGHAVFDDDFPATGLADNVGAADRAGFNQVGQGVVVDGMGTAGHDTDS